MKKNILLTGATGFIGSHLAENLLKSNNNLILIKRSHSDLWRIKNFINSSDNLKIFDIDKVNLSEIFETFDIEGILHLATYYSKFHNSNEIKEMINSNITFPTDLLEYASKNNTKYFINTGSCFEYSWDSIPISEKNDIKPFNLYASTKVAFEDVLKFYTDEYNLKTSTLKLFTPYGPKDDENKIIPYLIINSINKNKISIQSASKRLDPIFISDIVYAYNQTIKYIDKFDKSEAINIASGVSHTIKEIYLKISSILGENEVEFAESDLSELKGNIKKAETLIKWEPQINLEEGLRMTVGYYKDKKFKEEQNEKI